MTSSKICILLWNSLSFLASLHSLTIHFIHRSNLRFHSVIAWYGFSLLSCVWTVATKFLAHGTNHPKREGRHCSFITQLYIYLKDSLQPRTRLTVMLATFFHCEKQSSRVKMDCLISSAVTVQKLQPLFLYGNVIVYLWSWAVSL